MPTKIFVGRLVDGTTSDDISSLFRKFGHVTECDVLQNFGFVVSAISIITFHLWAMSQHFIYITVVSRFSYV